MKKLFSIFFGFFFLLLLSEGWCQLAPERLAWNNLGKERWGKAEAQVLKALKKDSLNLAANYVFSWFFFTEGNPRFNIDSASVHTNRTLHYFKQLPLKEKSRAIRFPFDSVGLYRLRNYIDSVAFDRAKKINTEEAYAFFIDHFSTAAQLISARELQHEVAFLEALKLNTYQSFDHFLKKYPQTTRSDEAKKRYEKLLFETKTKDKRLDSYVQFLKNHPESTYKEEAERQVFELSTASGELQSFKTFLTIQPTNRYARVARNFLFHIAKEKGEDVSGFLTDSLKQIVQLTKKTWYPVWKNGVYSFVTDAGEEFLTNVTDSLDSDMFCEGFNEDVLFAQPKLVARNGFVIHDQVSDYTDLGFGFLSIKSKGKSFIVHKSGQRCLPEAATLLGHHFLWAKGEATSSLHTLTGRELVRDSWMDVVSFGDAVAFKQVHGWKLATVKTIGQQTSGGTLVFTEFYDEVKRFNVDYLWVRKGALTALLNNSLQPVLQFSERKISEEEGLIVVRDKSTARIFANGRMTESFNTIQIAKDWIVTKASYGFSLTNRSTQEKSHFDSLYMVSSVAIGVRNDSIAIHTPAGILFYTKAFAELKSLADSSFIVVNEDAKKNILSMDGKKLFTLVCDKIDYVGGGLFVLTKKDKKSLADSNGEPVPLHEFDAFGNTTDRDIAVLSKKKFGLISTKTNKVIKPTYERNLRSYTDERIVAYKNGAYGFVDWNDNPLSKFEFEEIRYWNDTVAMVKHSFNWRLLDMESKTFKSGKIGEYTSFTKSTGEVIAIFHQDNYYGVMSNQRGVILEPTFTYIQNIGSHEEPFFFTEKYVEEASIYIVIYYNQQGVQIRRQIFEEEEYSKIRCEK